MTESHDCPLEEASEMVDPSWCFDTFAERLARLPPITVPSDVLRPELWLAEAGAFTVWYCPVDYVNRTARVVIVGITPGLHQMFLSCQAAQRALAEGLTGDDVLRRACEVGSFAGSMRTNLVAMLDGLGLPGALGIGSTARLFDERSDLLHSTSALIYPVFIRGKDYGGSPSPLKSPLLRAFVEEVFVTELAMVPDAVIIPLGRTVASLLPAEIERGAVVAERCLLDFPHISGANGHHAAQYEAALETMTAQVSAWATHCSRRLDGRSGAPPRGSQAISRQPTCSARLTKDGQ